MNLRRDIVWRVALVYIVIVALAVGILFQAAYIKTAQRKEYSDKQPSLKQSEKAILPVRGAILANNLQPLASTIPEYRIYMDLRADGLSDTLFLNNVQELSVNLSRLFRNQSAAAYKNELIQARKQNKRYFPIGHRWISYSEMKKASSFPIFRKGQYRGGFIVRQKNSRAMPFGDNASRTVGRLREHVDGTQAGYVGLERTFNNYLEGKPGLSIKQKVAGSWINFDVVEPQDGYDVVTTIDPDIQEITQQALLAQLVKYKPDWGSAIVMEVKTGKIRAISNFSKNSSDQYFETYNYAIGGEGCVEPGSTFKLASMIALLEDDMVKLNDSLETGKGVYQFYDRKMKDSHHGGFGKISVREAFEKSSNVGISMMINEHYKDKPQRFVNRLYDLNLHKTTNIDIKGEGTPLIVDPSDKSWYGTTLPWMSIGYGIKLTPLQILSFYNSVANNGQMLRPQIVEKVIDEGRAIKTNKKEVVSHSICSKETLNEVKSLLRGVVEKGTAKNLNDAFCPIAGKTGTAQIADGAGGYRTNLRYSASFVGYFPADAPEYSCIVMISGLSPKEYYGNIVAGTAFKEIANRIYAENIALFPYVDSMTGDEEPVTPYCMDGNKYNLTSLFRELDIKTKDASTQSQWVNTFNNSSSVTLTSNYSKKNTVPDVIGMGAKDAIYALEKTGLRVAIKGIGRVTEMSRKAGQNCKKGDYILIKLEPLNKDV